MNKFLVIVFLCLGFLSTSFGQSIKGGIAGPSISNDIHVVGKYILGSQGDTIILRGVNYAPYNWGWTSTDLRIDQVAQSNANVVRLVWYINGGGAPTYSNWTALDSAISKCVQAGMIAIPELHDQTCVNDSAALVSLLSWWTNPNFIQLLNKYRGYIILNYANEALGSGAWSWLGGSSVKFTNTYKTIITNLRNANITCPIMIDAPDCGGNVNALVAAGDNLQSYDPLHNLVFSVHAYWPLPTNTASVLSGKMDSLYNASVSFVLGEVANTGDCSDAILLDSLLKYATQKNIGWMAWSWDHDNCPSRQITSNSLMANTTLYGNKIINNPTYGLQAKAVKMLPPFSSGPLAITERLHLKVKAIGDHYLCSWNAISNATYYELIVRDSNNLLMKKSLTELNATVVGKSISPSSCTYVSANRDATAILQSNVECIPAFKNDFAIFPNPCGEFVQIVNNKFGLNVLSFQGQKVLDIPAYQNFFGMHNLPCGVYFVRHGSDVFKLVKGF